MEWPKKLYCIFYQTGGGGKWFLLAKLEGRQEALGQSMRYKAEYSKAHLVLVEEKSRILEEL